MLICSVLLARSVFEPLLDRLSPTRSHEFLRILQNPRALQLYEIQRAHVDKWRDKLEDHAFSDDLAPRCSVQTGKTSVHGAYKCQRRSNNASLSGAKMHQRWRREYP